VLADGRDVVAYELYTFAQLGSVSTASNLSTSIDFKDSECRQSLYEYYQYRVLKTHRVEREIHVRVQRKKNYSRSTVCCFFVVAGAATAAACWHGLILFSLRDGCSFIRR
jgi:hypothetical protein